MLGTLEMATEVITTMTIETIEIMTEETRTTMIMVEEIKNLNTKRKMAKEVTTAMGVERIEMVVNKMIKGKTIRSLIYHKNKKLFLSMMKKWAVFSKRILKISQTKKKWLKKVWVKLKKKISKLLSQISLSMKNSNLRMVNQHPLCYSNFSVRSLTKICKKLINILHHI